MLKLPRKPLFERLRATRGVLGGASILLLGVVAITCSAQNQMSGKASHGIAAPLGEAAARPPSPRLPPVEALSLEEFTPLLALPELKRVSLAVEADNPRLAAIELAATLAKSELNEQDSLRFQFLLGRLDEQAGDLPQARAAYDRAAAKDWPLSDYARLGAGRVLVRMGKHKEALVYLAKTGENAIVVDARRLLVAEAAFHLGDTAAAIENWRTFLDKSEGDVEGGFPIALELAEALLEQAVLAGRGEPAHEQLREALRWSRRVSIQAVDNPGLVERARRVERRVLDALAPAERASLLAPSAQEELLRASVLYDAKKYAEAEAAADTLLGRLNGKTEPGLVCDAATLRSKARAGRKEWGAAADGLNDARAFCKADSEQLARALFLGAKYAAADGRHALAIKLSEELERELPKHRLADDARIRAAQSYYELGSEARFTELLTRLPDDYPDGDMVLDGVFGLAVRRIEKSDWSGAASILDRAAQLTMPNDSARGLEFSGRERYFRARAFIETGERDRGFRELEAIVRELPLSYYMLHAYSRLVEVDPFRAKRARDEGIALALKNPFSFARRPEFDTPAFVRAMELLRVGELDYAGREVALLGLSRSDAAPAVLWGIALLYARAGSAKLSHAVARGLLSDWLQRWPAGDWTKAWELAFPRPYRDVVDVEVKKNAISESLAYAIMREESAFDPEVVSPADAYGLMQLIVPTARHFAAGVGLPFDATSLKRPRVNIALGCRALGKLSSAFGKNPLLAIPAYNAGPGRPARWLRERPGTDFDVWVELIPYNETRRYTKRVLASRAAYAYLYQNDLADLAMTLPTKLSL